MHDLLKLQDSLLIYLFPNCLTLIVSYIHNNFSLFCLHLVRASLHISHYTTHHKHTQIVIKHLTFTNRSRNLITAGILLIFVKNIFSKTAQLTIISLIFADFDSPYKLNPCPGKPHDTFTNIVIYRNSPLL